MTKTGLSCKLLGKVKTDKKRGRDMNYKKEFKKLGNLSETLVAIYIGQFVGLQANMKKSRKLIRELIKLVDKAKATK